MWEQRVAPYAVQLLQLWDMLHLDSLHDKYLRPVTAREVCPCTGAAAPATTRRRCSSRLTRARRLTRRLAHRIARAG